MSAKVAVVIGDYSNGWSDSIVVQDVGRFKQSDCAKDREVVQGLMTKALNMVLEGIESNELVNPKPKDEPCCDEFEKWAKEQRIDSKVKACPFCGTKLTEERKKKYFVALTF